MMISLKIHNIYVIQAQSVSACCFYWSFLVDSLCITSIGNKKKLNFKVIVVNRSSVSAVHRLKLLDFSSLSQS